MSVCSWLQIAVWELPVWLPLMYIVLDYLFYSFVNAHGFVLVDAPMGFNVGYVSVPVPPLMGPHWK